MREEGEFAVGFLDVGVGAATSHALQAEDVVEGSRLAAFHSDDSGFLVRGEGAGAAAVVVGTRFLVGHGRVSTYDCLGVRARRGWRGGVDGAVVGVVAGIGIGGRVEGRLGMTSTWTQPTYVQVCLYKSVNPHGLVLCDANVYIVYIFLISGVARSHLHAEGTSARTPAAGGRHQHSDFIRVDVA